MLPAVSEFVNEEIKAGTAAKLVHRLLGMVLKFSINGKKDGTRDGKEEI